MHLLIKNNNEKDSFTRFSCAVGAGGHLAELPAALRGGGGVRLPGVRGGGHRALPLQGRGLRDCLQV